MSLHRAWIALGSNIEPERFLPLAVKELSTIGSMLCISSVWCSAPVGDPHQADFCNAAVLLEVSQNPEELKSLLRAIETRLGRVRDPHNKNAARTIDLDLSLYDDLIEESLGIPDPEIPARPFLAVPLAELTPDFVHPVLQVTLREIADRTDQTQLIRMNDLSDKLQHSSPH